MAGCFIDAAAIPVAGSTRLRRYPSGRANDRTDRADPWADGGIGLVTARIGMVHQFAVVDLAGVSKKEMVESIGATFIELGNGAVDRVHQIAVKGVRLIVDLIGRSAAAGHCPWWTGTQ